MESAIQRAAWAVIVASALVCEVSAEGDDQKVFLREFTLIRHDHLPEETAEGPGGHKPDDPNSRTARSEEDRDTLWDAWGPWSECSRTCGGGASYSLRRCLSSRTCEGQNIKYRTCSNVDCPPGAGDFRAQQCSAHADVRYQGRYHDWIPVDNDPENPCALKCRARGLEQVVELAPKVLDGTRCYTESLDMCINGACQIVGCDHELGSTAKEDNCGVCNGDGSSCRLVRGHYKSQQLAGKSEDTVVVVPFGSRHVRLVSKGPDHLYLESKTLQGVKGESSLSDSGQHHLENTTIDFQKFPDKEVLRMTGPLRADFTIKIRSVGSTDSVVQFIFYQPIIHRWRETDFFPCSVTCGGGYQLTSAECYDLRSGRVIVDQYCHYYPENIKPKPKLQECNMDPCPASDGYKQIMPYDLYHPLPRWESSPWTACSTSCGGGIQTRSVSCVEEDIQGTVTTTEEWKCLYAPKTPILQSCNTFDCPTWLAQEWSPCTVTCGQGLWYRVVLCVDYRGLHTGGCNAKTKPHIKEECLVPVPCYKPVEKLPVEAKSPWFKQAQELDEETTVSEEPTFVPGPWSPCSHTCGAGTQTRAVRCQVLLSFSRTMADLPDDECKGSKPPKTQSCYQSPCRDLRVESQPGNTDRGQAEEGEEKTRPSDWEELYEWEYKGFTECSESCGGGVQEAVVICRNKQTREPSKESQCVSIRRPPQLLRACGTAPCPPRWETGVWSTCSATCGVGLQTRSVSCVHPRTHANNHTVTASDKACQAPKPTMVQACNRFDCPPMWEQQDWGPCSHSCRNGTQRRGMLCKQRLADGSVLELPDTFCPSPAPATVQICAWKACPPRWMPTEWSQCSVTCGEGTQSLVLVCQQQDEDGVHRTLAPSACSTLPQSRTFRICSLGPCTRAFRPSSTKQGPSILAQRKVYIQWRKEKKLQFVTGGYAYLFPRTSVVIRCPTRRFRKDQVGWLKDGKPLANTPHLVITPLGYVKIQHLGPTNTGLYTCLAGQVREDFVLKLTGSKKKLAVEEADIWKTNSYGKVYPESPSPQDRWQSLSRYDAVVQRLLDLKGLAQNGQDYRELRESGERNGSALENEDMMGEAQSPAMLVVEMWHLDAILRNLSLWPGELGGIHGNQVLVQLLGELVRHHVDSNESTLLHPEWSEPPKQGSDTYKATSSFGTHTSKSGISTASVRDTAQAPTIIQKSHSTEHKSSSEVVAHVGAPILLLQTTTSIELKCDTSGVTEPVVTWSKDGKELYYSDRVALLPGASLRIQALSKADEGLYTCTAKNSVGSTSLSSLLRMAGPLQTTDHTADQKATCTGQDCPQRWLSSPWSICSVSCGGGVQSRRVTCLLGERVDGVGATEGNPCAQAGRRPPDTQSCNLQPCKSWATSAWSPCHGPCVGPHLAMQQRQVFCQTQTGTRLPSVECRSLPRPNSHRNCSTESCFPQWRTGPWTQCTATCGSHGFQSRRVTCIRPRGPSGAPLQLNCPLRGRPAGWRRCNIQPCSGAGECRDSTRYCEKVQQLELCSLAQFKTRCCESCRAT